MNKSRTFITVVLCVCVFVTCSVVYHLETLESSMIATTQTRDMNTIVQLHIDDARNHAIQSSPEEKVSQTCRTLDSSVDKMTSLNVSKVLLVEKDNNGNVIVSLTAYDKKLRPKSYGEDNIVVWAEQEKGDGRISGQVTDHKNGSYSGNVTVFWKGKTRIYFKLLSSIENTCRRWKALEKYGNNAFALQTPRGVVATFRKVSPKLLAHTNCGAVPWIHGFRDLCNFTTLNGGFSWYCGKPRDKRINCSNIYSFSSKPLTKVPFDKSYMITDPGHGVFKESVIVDVKAPSVFKQPSVPCSKRSPILSWTEPSPSGYWWNNEWRQLNCRVTVKQTITEYRTCLKNKHIIMTGDSTVRQYAEYLVDKVLGKGKTSMKNVRGPNNTYHMRTPISNHSISLWFYKHEMPFHAINGTWIKSITAVPDLISTVAATNVSDRDIILLVYYNSHLSAYPTGVYRDRIRKLAEALQSFIASKPRAKVLYKGFHVMMNDERWFDARISDLLFDILREEFKALMYKVIYLDTQSITVAHNSELLHPEGKALLSQIHQFMSYLC